MKFKSRKKEQLFWGYLFLGFPLLLLTVFVFFPIGFAFVVSFYDWNLLIPDKPFVGLGNYFELFQDKVFIKAIKNTIIYTMGVVPVQTLLSLFLAFLMNQKIKGRAFFRTAFYIPAITSSVVTSIIFVWIYSKPGLLNYGLNAVGVDSNIDWLTNPTTVLPSIMMLNIWTTSGYFMVSFLAGLQNIPSSLYEAAKIDGASQWQQFWKITVPMVRPVTYFVVIMSLIGCFQVFDQIFIMSSGGPDNASTTMSYFVYQNSFKYFRFGFGAASAAILALLIFATTIIQKKYFPPDAY
ncbi:carbohydrate ABC transporter permease [Flagellimonas sp. S174]|uniref:carbohydrate ABC transporter permease n=1 Tax=Flagellimonas sp. S174 TaxID=3410790 RepID=UPI003BF51882